MSNSYLNLAPAIQQQIMSYASQYSFDGLTACAVAQIISGGNQFNSNNNLLVTNYGVGVMGVSLSLASSLGLDASNENQNIQAGVMYLSQLLAAFFGNYALALAAYVTSVATVQSFNGVPPLPIVQNFVYNVSTIAAKAGSSAVSGLYAIRNQVVADPTAAGTETGNIIAPTTHGINYGSGYTPEQGAQNLAELANAMDPSTFVDDPSLNNTPWYQDQGLVTGNSRVRNSVQPVAFTVYLDRSNPNSLIMNSNGQPVEIQLNTSMTTFEITSKHVYNRTPSRTGMHITLWGMQPDLISGTGSTGVFMNQFGITDFFSVANVTDDVRQLVTNGFSQSFKSNYSDQAGVSTTGVVSAGGNSVVPTSSATNTAFSTGQVFTNSASGSPTLSDNIINSVAEQDPADAFRVAAQDAFVELLKLFQMNGNVWFNTPGWQGYFDGQEQQGVNAWSPKTGASSFQQHSRNNDVMTRGYVSMRYRNNVFLGYFKTLSWTQDAESPFQWKFNFTFQVERTYTALYFPNFSVTQSNQDTSSAPQPNQLPNQIYTNETYSV